MGSSNKQILIVGLFLSAKNKGKIIRSAADQLAELLSKNQIRITTVSKIVNQPLRLLDTVAAVLFKSPSYKIAIVPLYAGYRSFVWEYVTTKLLKAIGKKVVMIVHGGEIPAKMERNPAKYVNVLRSADVVVCPSNFLVTTLAKYDIAARLIENVVNLQNYEVQQKRQFGPKIYWMRTIEDVYNPEMAVRVAAILSKKFPDFKMVMAGYDRGMLQVTKDLAKKLQVADKIEFPGYISNDQKNRYARELDIYICTNRIDNAPISFVEMMAMGIPIVSVRIGGIPFMVEDGTNGLLVELDDDQAMADAICKIIMEPGLGMRLVANGLEYAKRYDEQPVMEKWKKLFYELGY